ncbi:hypothetical protein M1M07_10850 [Rhodococcus sp. HM1]|uniref:hypothetical protein n=1 Tax=Rhodococcus sp. HM1 TaxID=2937759 RepID=UPI00200AA68C|nr:hypothetical protein [Rhodococcus sp. HM1]MCK8671615.1 hypothetical protein [Rhodococcus sp. HM1]
MQATTIVAITAGRRDEDEHSCTASIRDVDPEYRRVRSGLCREPRPHRGQPGPWGVAQTPVNSLTFNGTDGTITLIAGCVAGASLLLRAVWDSLWPFVVAMLAGVVCAVTGFVDMSRGQALFSDDQMFVSVGWGLWLLCIGSVALLLGVALCAITQARNSDWTIGAELRELAGNPRELTFAIASALCAIATIILVLWAISV